MYRSRTLVAVFMAALLQFGHLGCSDDVDPPKDAGAPPDADTTVADTTVADTGELDAPPTELTITVLELKIKADGGVDKPPLKGASVAVDLPGGKRLETRTDASGQATFEGIDWSAGSVDVIAAKVGYTIMSTTGLTKTEGSRELVLAKPRPWPNEATISGTAKGWDGTANLWVSASTGTTDFQKLKTGTYTLKVEAGKPATIVGFLWKMPSQDPVTKTYKQPVLGWATTDCYGKGTTRWGTRCTMDLDFTKPLAGTTFKGTVDLATGAKGFYMYVEDYRTGSFGPFYVGLPKEWNCSTSPCTFKGEYFTSKAVTLPVAYYYSDFGKEVGTTYVIKEGYPQDGVKITGFLTPVPLTKPTDLTLPVKLSTTFEWTLVEKLDGIYMNIFTKQGRGIWTARVPPDATSFTLPRPPSDLKLADLLGTTALYARLQLCAGETKTKKLCARKFVGKTFRFEPSF